MSKAVKEYTIASRQAEDGISVPVSPVVVIDPSSDPLRLIPQGWWLYQARRVNTSGGAGALVIRIQTNPGQVAILTQLYAQGPASAGATLTCQLFDEDAAQTSNWAGIAAGANREFNLPSIGASAATNGNISNSVNAIIGPGQILRVNASTSLLNETMVVGVVLLLSTSAIPLWDITGSVAGSALAASTISEANTLQKVDLPW